jgi:hypothetical protein
MLSSNVKYIGLDVHKEAITVAVRNGAGKLVMESIVETKASTLLQFLEGLRGELHVTLEEGTWAAWLYDVLKPHVQEIVVCNPRRNALLKEGSKNDRVVWRQAIFRLATTKIPDTCCNFFLSSLVSLLLAVPKRSAEGAKRRPCQSPFLCGTCLQLQPDAPK